MKSFFLAIMDKKILYLIVKFYFYFDFVFYFMRGLLWL